MWILVNNIEICSDITDTIIEGSGTYAAGSNVKTSSCNIPYQVQLEHSRVDELVSLKDTAVKGGF